MTIPSSKCVVLVASLMCVFTTVLLYQVSFNCGRHVKTSIRVHVLFGAASEFKFRRAMVKCNLYESQGKVFDCRTDAVLMLLYLKYP